MGKFTYAILMAFALELAMYFFGGTTYSQSSLFSVLFNPSTLASSDLYLTIKVLLVAFAAATIVVGNFYQINIYALYAAVSVVIISFVFSIINFFAWFYGELGSHMSAEFAQFVAVIVVAPLILYFLIACVEWVRSNT